MSRERMVLIGVGALVVIGLLFAGGSLMQRNAWMEGYIMGRMTAAPVVSAGAAQVAPVAPVAPYAAAYPVGFSHHGPGGFLFFLLFAGMIFFVITRIVRRAHWRSWAAHGGPPWAQQWGPQGDWHQGPPWMREGGQPGGPQGDWRQGPPWMQGMKGSQGEQPAATPAEPKPAEPKPTEPPAER